MTDKRIFRSTAALAGGWGWMVFAAANMIDIAVRGRDSAALIAAAALLLGCGIAYVLGLRPRVVADETGVRVRNPLRDVVVPWQAVEKITAPQSIQITYTGRDRTPHETSSWVLQTSPRERAKAERQAGRSRDERLAQYVANRTAADFAAEQLTELADIYRRAAEATTEANSTGADHGGSDGAGSAELPAGRVIWSPLAVAALVVPALLLSGAVLVATLHH